MSRMFETRVSSVYPHYVSKVEKRGRTKCELHEVIEWLAGFDEVSRQGHLTSGMPKILRGSGPPDGGR